MHNLYYHCCDLDQLPVDFYPDLLSRIQDPGRIDTSLNHTRPDYTSRILTNGAWKKPSTRSQRFDTDERFKAWIRENVADRWTECSVSITETSLSDTHGAHTDWSRHWVLLYILDTGGDDCRTVWYQQKGQPVLRSDLGCYVTDYSELQEIGHVKMIAHNWYAINSQILHGVESVTRDRITVQIGFWDLASIKSKFTNKENT